MCMWHVLQHAQSPRPDAALQGLFLPPCQMKRRMIPLFMFVLGLETSAADSPKPSKVSNVAREPSRTGPANATLHAALVRLHQEDPSATRRLQSLHEGCSALGALATSRHQNGGEVTIQVSTPPEAARIRPFAVGQGGSEGGGEGGGIC